MNKNIENSSITILFVPAFYIWWFDYNKMESTIVDSFLLGRISLMSPFCLAN